MRIVGHETRRRIYVNPSLFGLAVLKVNWDKNHRDYIDIFVPMAAECIINKRYHAIALVDLQQDFETLFGLRLPQHVLRGIVTRMKKRGFLRQADGMYTPVAAKLETTSILQTRRSILDMHAHVLDILSCYVRDCFSISWSAEDSEIALHSYLRAHDQAENSLLSITPPKTSAPGARYMVAKFVQYVTQNDDVTATYLDTIIKGSMLADAIFMTEPANQQMRFRNTDIYLDTPILMNALGYDGEILQAPCLEMLDLIRKARARLKAFSHTVDEVRGILFAHASNLSRSAPSNGYGSAFDHFLSLKLTSSDVQLMAERLEVDLAQIGVQVVDKPEYTHEHVIDEASFQTALESEVSYLRTPALKHDIDCVSAIIRLRKGRSPHRLEDCRAVFVTQNRGLTRASRYFFSSGYSANISPCITDYELTSLLWLKLPSIVPDLPMKMLIANCYAAVQPSKELWTKYLQEVERLNNLGQCTPDEYYALRYSLYAKDALMKCTLGVEKAFVEGTVHDVLAAARERIVTEAKNAAKKELATEQKKRVDAEQTANAAISKISDVQNRVAHFSASTASVIVWGVQAFMAIVLLIGILISFVGVGTMGTTSRITATVVTVCYLTWLFCSFMGIWSGLTIREKLDMMQARLESSINSLITRWLGFERQHDNLQH